MSVLQWGKSFLEYLGGENDVPPKGMPPFFATPWFWGLWWAVLMIMIWLFGGQTSKFIYIDF